MDSAVATVDLGFVYLEMESEPNMAGPLSFFGRLPELRPMNHYDQLHRLDETLRWFGVNPDNFLSVVPTSSQRLEQNYPNPFNPLTTIRFTLSCQERVRLTIYNAAGQRLTTLIDERLIAGAHTVVWDGVNETGEYVSSGIYLYRLETDTFIEQKKMLLLK